MTKRYDAFGPLLLSPSNVVTPVFHHESTPHLLLDTNSVYMIHFVLVGDWFVHQTANKLQTQWEKDVSHHDVPKAVKETFRPFFCCFLLTHFTFPGAIQMLWNVLINSKDNIFLGILCAACNALCIRYNGKIWPR